MTDHRNLVVAVAGAFTIAASQVAITVLQTKLSWATVILVTAAIAVATYIAAYTIVEQFYANVIWPRFSRRNLSGTWRMSLTNLQDSSTRTGIAQITHTPDSLVVSCVNFRPGTDTPYSSWTSAAAVFTDNTTLLLIYQVESTVDWKPFKRGVMRLQVAVERPEQMMGDFFDNAPSDDRGPIMFVRSTAGT